jgi:hypothetical protein
MLQTCCANHVAHTRSPHRETWIELRPYNLYANANQSINNHTLTEQKQSDHIGCHHSMPVDPLPPHVCLAAPVASSSTTRQGPKSRTSLLHLLERYQERSRALT